MSLTYGSSKIGYSSGQHSFNGLGQFYARADASAEFARRLLHPNANVVTLITVETVFSLQSIRPLGLTWFDNVPDAVTVTDLRYNNGESLTFDPTQGGGFAPLQGTWYVNSSNNSVVFQPVGNRIELMLSGEDVYGAVATFNFSTTPKDFRSAAWRSRIKSTPAVNLRIPDAFTGISQVGGGQVVLLNDDGFFDEFRNHSWDAGRVIMEIGIDLPGDPMAIDDYMQVGEWRIQSVEFKDTDFTLRLAEPKTRLEASIPYDVFDRAQFPSIQDADVGRIIPRAYGVILGAAPVVLDATLRKFKVAHHRIRSFDAIRMRQSFELAVSAAVTSWILHSSTTFLTVESDEVLNVAFNGTDLTKRNSIAAVVANAGSWHQEGGSVYVNPQGGQTITSGTYTLTRQTSFDAWTPIDFASVDLAKAEFTLGAVWDREAALSVDFTGRVLPNGEPMVNPADVMVDLLDYIGETVFDADSFDAARRAFHVGYDRFDKEVTHLKVGFYVDASRQARDWIEELCQQVNAFLFVDYQGRWRFLPFIPLPGARLDFRAGQLLRNFSDNQVILGSWSEQVDFSQLFPKARVSYAQRIADGWSQFVQVMDRRIARQHNLAELPVVDRVARLYDTDDATYYAQRLLTTEAQPRTTRRLVLPWLGFLIHPTDQIRIARARGEMDEVVEVLEATHDFGNRRISLTVGDRQSWRDTFGFWVQNSMTTVLPQFDIWLKADVVNQTDGALFEAWPDESGNSRHARINADPNLPFTRQQVQYRANQRNGQPAMRFNLRPNDPDIGTITRLRFQNWGPPSWTAGEMWAVLKMDADPSPSAAWFDGIIHDFGTSGNATHYPFTDGRIYEGWGSTTRRDCGNPAPSLTGWRLYHVRSSATEYTVEVDGAVLFTSGVNTVGWRSEAFLGWGNQAAFVGGFNGFLAEYIVLGRTATAPERDAVEQMLSTKYALGIVAPSTSYPSWSSSWTDAEALNYRLNSGFWAGVAIESGDLVDPFGQDQRSKRAGRWW